MNITSVTVSPSQQSGYLAGEAGFDLPVQPLRCQRGWYLGTFSDELGPVSRESEEYFPSADLAEQALQSGVWTQRHSL